MGIDAAQQQRSGRRAARMGVKIGEAHAITGQRIQVRCLDLATVRSHIGKTQVIAEDDDDVRSAWRFRRQGVGRQDTRRKHTGHRQKGQ
jgi:hypothetical protein